MKVFLTVALLSYPLEAAVPAPGASALTTIDVPGALQTFPCGINDAGEVVGYFEDARGNHHGFVRASAGIFTAIDVPGHATSTASGINNAGEIVGNFADASISGYATAGHGFVRTAGGTFTTIDVPGAFSTTATGINNAGQIVGNFSNTSREMLNSKTHGFVRAAGGTFTTFDVPQSGGFRAYGINDAGQIVGDSFEAAGKSHGFVRSSGGTFTTFDVPGAAATAARAINNAGQIVGFFEDPGFAGARGNRHGFVRAAGGTFTAFDVPDAAETFPCGINTDGRIVGVSYPGGRAFIFDMPGATAPATGRTDDAGQMAGKRTLRAVLLMAVTAFILGLGVDLRRNKARQRREQLALGGLAPTRSMPAAAEQPAGAQSSEDAVLAPSSESTSGPQLPPWTKAAEPHGAGEGTLWIRWTLATVMGWLGGIAVSVPLNILAGILSYVISAAGIMLLDLGNLVIVLIPALAALLSGMVGAVIGGVVAAPQALVLRRRGVRMRSWVGATAAGFAIWFAATILLVLAVWFAAAVAAGFPLSNVTSFIKRAEQLVNIASMGWAGLSAMLIGLAVYFAMVGLVIGTGQGRVLGWSRGQVRVWARATGAGLGLGIGATGAIAALLIPAHASLATWSPPQSPLSQLYVLDVLVVLLAPGVGNGNYHWFSPGSAATRFLFAAQPP